MAVSPIYRESWTKNNGWNVRVDFIPSSSDAAYYDERSVTNLYDVFIDVSDHECKFELDKLGMPSAQSCKFVVNYSNCPSAMKTALVSPSTDYVDSLAGSISVQNIFVVWTDYGTGTYVPVFIGSQRVAPTDKFTVLKNEAVKIEIDAIGIHKVAEKISLYAICDAIAIGNVVVSMPFTEEFFIAQYGYMGRHVIYSTSNSIYKDHGYYHSIGDFCKVSDFFTALNTIYSSVMCTCLRQTSHSSTKTYTQLDENILQFTKFYEQNGLVEVTSPYFMVSAAWKGGELDPVPVIRRFADYWLYVKSYSGVGHSRGGMLTTNKNEYGFIKDAANLWELIHVLACNFYAKYLPNYSKVTFSSHDSLIASFDLAHPLSGRTGAALQTLEYDEGTSSEWERNAEIKSKCVVHTDFPYEEDTREFTSTGLFVASGDEQIEFNAVFNWFITSNNTPMDTLQYNPRGLYYDAGTGASGGKIFAAVSPRSENRWVKTSAWTVVGGTLKYVQGDDWDVLVSNQLLNHGVNQIAYFYATHFGGNQVAYEGDYQLSQYLIPSNVGDRFDINGHADFSLPTKAMLMECKINWGSNSSLVSCKFLTRNTLSNYNE